MERQTSFRTAKAEKQLSFREAVDRQQSFRDGMERQKSFRGRMEKQKSFRGAMVRQLSFGGERKRGKDSPGKRGDSPLHLAARSGNLGRVREILQDCDDKASKELLSKQNLDGETALYAAAENGHATVVSEFLKHLDLQTASIAAKNDFDPFHVATKHGHFEVLKELLHAFPNLAMTTDSSNSTALQTAATQGHIDIVNLLLETDSDLAKIARNNGKTALHSAARKGHLEIVRSLLMKDPSTGFRTDKKGQTALHMAVKGQNVEMVHELLRPDPAILSFCENKGDTALHIATRKHRAKMVQCLLAVDGIDINAINKAGETPLDIAEASEDDEITTLLKETGGMRSRECVKPQNPAKQLKQTVSDIKHDVQSQLQQTRQTKARIQKIAKRVEKLHTGGLNNAINSSTLVAVLIATVAFAAIFTVPGQFVEENPGPGSSVGQACIARQAAFVVFFLSDSLALFISLAVVVVQTSLVVIEQKKKKQMMFVINKFMWLACLFISIAFISITYVVVGSDERWLFVCAAVIGSSIMLTTIGSMCYCIILHRLNESKSRSIQRAESLVSASRASEPEIAKSGIYAL